MKYVVAVRIFRFLRDCIFVPLADKQAQAKKDLLPDHLAVCNQLMSIYTFHGWYICLYSTDIALIAQSNSFNHIFIQRLILRWVGEKDALALYRRLQFHGPPAISSKPGVLREKHFHTIMETIQEHIMVERERLKKGSLDWIREQC